MSSTPRFIHLRLHSEYSLLEGAIRVKKLPGLCADAGMPAVAITDTNNMFAALEFSVGAAGAGVQPIVGCQVDVAYEPTAPGEKARAPAALVLLAQSEAGYENLMKLISCLYLRGDGSLPHVTLDEISAHSGGLICLTGGPDGPLGVEPLMGWTSSPDTTRQVRLEFATLEEAVEYAERKGIEVRIDPAHAPTEPTISYSDNFRSDRVAPWTH